MLASNPSSQQTEESVRSFMLEVSSAPSISAQRSSVKRAFRERINVVSVSELNFFLLLFFNSFVWCDRSTRHGSNVQ